MAEETAPAETAETAPGNALVRSSRRRHQAANPSDNRQQPRTVSARLTDADYSALVSRAASAGLGPSTYIARLIEEDLAIPVGANRRWPTRNAPTATQQRAAECVRALGVMTGALLHWLREARDLGVSEAAINEIGRLTPAAREALADARATVDALRGQ